jgi:hypothetical protein
MSDTWNIGEKKLRKSYYGDVIYTNVGKMNFLKGDIDNWSKAHPKSNFSSYILFTDESCFFVTDSGEKVQIAFYLCIPLEEDNLDWTPKGSEYEQKGGKLKKFKFGVNKKEFDKWMKKAKEFIE